LFSSDYKAPPATPDEVRVAVAGAVCFSVRWKGPSSAARTQTLAEARKVAARLDRANGTKAARVYAVSSTERAARRRVSRDARSAPFRRWCWKTPL
jgi:hypothetical protein